MLNNFYVLSPCLALFWPSLIFILRDHIIYRVYSVTSPGESYDSVEDQCQGRASSAVHLVEGWSVFHFHFLKISRAFSVVPLSFSQDIQSFVSCSLSLSQDIHSGDLQVARLRRATSTRWRRRSTKVAPLPSCRSSKPRWTLSLFQDHLEWNYKQERQPYIAGHFADSEKYKDIKRD